MLIEKFPSVVNLEYFSCVERFVNVTLASVGVVFDGTLSKLPYTTFCDAAFNDSATIGNRCRNLAIIFEG